jgi:hypothetical protein
MVCSACRPSSLVQLRNAVLTGDTRDTRPYPDIREEGRRRPGLRTSGMPQFGNSGGKIRQNFAVARHTFQKSPFNATVGSVRRTLNFGITKTAD